MCGGWRPTRGCGRSCRRGGAGGDQAAAAGELRAAARERDPEGRERVFRDRARRQTGEVSAFIDQHRARFGVEPICRILGVSASAYYGARSGPRSARHRRRAAARADPRVCTGALRRLRLPQLWLALRRDGHAGRSRPRLAADAPARHRRRQRRGSRWRTTTPTRRAARAATWSSRNFPLSGRTAVGGRPHLPALLAGRRSSASCSMPTPGASSAGSSPPTCAPTWCWTPCRWPSPAASRPRSSWCTTRTPGRSTPYRLRAGARRARVRPHRRRRRRLRQRHGRASSTLQDRTDRRPHLTHPPRARAGRRRHGSPGRTPNACTRSLGDPQPSRTRRPLLRCTRSPFSQHDRRKPTNPDPAEPRPPRTAVPCRGGGHGRRRGRT